MRTLYGFALAFMIAGFPAYASAGLIGQWKLDEGTGTTTIDSSGNGYHGSWSGTPSGDTGYYDTNATSSLSYSGSFGPGDDFVSISGIETVVKSTTFWAYIPNLDGTTEIISKSFSGNGFEIIINGGTIQFYTMGSDVVAATASSSDINLNDWNYITATYNGPGTTMRLYINGHPSGSTATAPASVANVPVLYFGTWGSGGRQFVGNLNDVRLYDVELTEEQIGNVMAGSDDPDEPPVTDPILYTNQATSVTKTSAVLNGHLVLGSIAIEEMGFFYDTDESLEDPQQIVVDTEVFEDGDFHATTTELVCEQGYFFKAYMIDAEETLWESDTVRSFTTFDCADPPDEPLGMNVYDIIEQTFANGDSWASVAVSDSGDKMVATGIDNENPIGMIYTSEDGGASWTLRASVPEVIFTSTTISSDGTKMAAIGLTIFESEELEDFSISIIPYVSTDGGITWEEQNELDTVEIDEIDMITMVLLLNRISASDDFSKIYLTFLNEIYVSEDEGDSWDVMFDFSGAPFLILLTSLDVSADGKKVSVALVSPFAESPLTIIVGFTDGEVSWVRELASESFTFPSVAMSAGGGRIFATDLSGDMHISLNGGGTWEISENPDGYIWLYTAPSDTGNGVFASAYSNDDEKIWLYYSENAGAEWIRQGEASLSYSSFFLFGELLGNISGNSNLSKIGLVNFGELYVITRGSAVAPPPTQNVLSRALSGRSVYCTETRTTFCRAGSSPIQVQTFESIVTQYRDLLLQAHSLGISLPQNILDLLGIQVATFPFRALEVGISGNDVRALQNLLIAQGYQIPAGATGFFGNQTRAALAAYQQASGISPASGYFGSITRAFMKTADLDGLWW